MGVDINDKWGANKGFFPGSNGSAISNTSKLGKRLQRRVDACRCEGGLGGEAVGEGDPWVKDLGRRA